MRTVALRVGRSPRAVLRTGPRWRRSSLGVVLLVHADLLTEHLAPVEELQRMLEECDLVAGRRALLDLPLGEDPEHADPVDADTGVDEPPDQTGDRQVAGRIAKLAVLEARADQPLLLPVAEHASGHADLLRQSR